MDVVVDDFDVDAALTSGREVLEEFFEFGSAYTVGTVDCEGTIDSTTVHESLERVGHLGIIPLLSRLAELVRCAFGVDAPYDVVKLRSGKDTEICVVDSKDVQSGSHGFDKSNTRRTCVATKDHLSRALMNLPQLIYQLFIDKLLVCLSELFDRSVGKSRGVTFPVLLRRVNDITI